MSSWMRMVLGILATWRVTHLLASEDGPGDAMVRLRVWLGQRSIGRVMDCFNCLSIWVAVPAALFLSRSPLERLVSWVALSGAACLLERLGPAWQMMQGESDYVLRPETFDVEERRDGVHPSKLPAERQRQD